MKCSLLCIVLCLMLNYAMSAESCVYVDEAVSNLKIDLRGLKKYGELPTKGSETTPFFFSLCDKYPLTSLPDGYKELCSAKYKPEDGFSSFQTHATDNPESPGFCFATGKAGVVNVKRDEELIVAAEIVHVAAEKPDDRSLTFRLVCSPEEYYSEGVVEETSMKYFAEVRTIHACPVVCRTGTNAVCGNNGICGVDTSRNEARCFCNAGYSGKACNVKGGDVTDGDTVINIIKRQVAHKGTQFLLFMDIFLLLLVLFVTGYVVYKTRMVADNGNLNYSKMDDSVPSVMSDRNNGQNLDDLNSINYIG